MEREFTFTFRLMLDNLASVADKFVIFQFENLHV